MYPPLKHTDSIRLLLILPDSNGSEIRVSLTEVKLSDNPSYQCLSYTWGTSVDEAHITLDGTPHPVRQNLFRFLCRVRSATEPRVVWVDALCISQTDLTEKAQQVAMIGIIFRKATRVLVWLGEGANDSEALFRPWPAQPRWRRALSTPLSTSSLRQRVAVWNAFLSRPYWRRTWIVQEIICANAIVVHCGADVADWEDLIVPRLYAVAGLSFDGVNLVSSRLPSAVGVEAAECFSANVQVIERLANSRWLYRQDRGSPRPGHEIIYTFPSFAKNESFDRRDKIYAMISLEPDQGFRDAVGVDYKIDIKELFARVLTALAPGYDGRLASSSLVKIFDMSRHEASEVLVYLASREVACDPRCLAFLERYVLEGITSPFSDAPRKSDLSPRYY